MKLYQTLEFLYKNEAKIEAKNGKLKINVSPSIMTSEIQSFIKTNKNAIVDFIEKANDIHEAEESEYYDISSAQRQFYLLNRLGGESLAYNLQHFLEIRGTIDIVKLEQAFLELIQRHEILRTTYHVIEGEVKQKIHQDFPFDLLFSEVRREDLNQKLKDFIQPFNLEEGPLFRAELMKLEKDVHVLALDFSHIVTDGVSSGVLTFELAALYNDERLEDVEFQYKDYAVWQQSDPYQLKNLSHKEFWLKEFSDGVPEIELPLDFNRSNEKKKGLLYFDLSKEQTQKLVTLARSEKTTLFNLIFSLFGLFVGKLCNEEDLIIGTPTAGRVTPKLENMVGVFLNTLPIRIKFSPEMTFKEFLKGVSLKMLECLEYQSYPFEDLVNELGIERRANENPLFNTIFNFENFDTPSFEMGDLQVQGVANNNDTPGFDLNLIATENDDTLNFKVVYDAKLFKAETITLFVKYFNRIIEKVIENKEEKLSSLNMLSDEDKNQLLQINSGLQKEFDGENILDLFNQQVANAPEEIAVEHPSSSSSFFVVHENQKISYRELDEKSNQLCHYLKFKGVVSGDFIPIFMDGSVDFIIAVLGVLKAGCAYVPIDKNYPEKRISYILNDVNADFVLTSTSLKDLITSDKEISHIYMDTEEYSSYSKNASKIPVDPSSIAYAIYTSGTTGNPKGAMISHASLHNYISSSRDFYVNESRSNFPLFTSVSFDLTITSIFTPLATGNSVIIYNDEEVTERIKRIFYDGHVDIIKLTPSHLSLLNTLFEGSENFQIDRLILGGERLDNTLCQETQERLGAHIDIYNEYGPTECTVGCTIHKYQKDEEKSTVSIGKPFWNTECYILNDSMQLVPKGGIGEMYIGGIQLANGYLNRPELSDTKFVNNPFSSKEESKLYKTGDLARWSSNGDLEFLGRKDEQVKINGYRVELGELESVLSQLKEVENAVIHNLITKEKDIFVAYYTSEEELQESYLKNHLLGYFSKSIIPNSFVHLESIPLTVNGKVDYRQLPIPELASEETYIAPINEIEEKLIEIWAGVLEISKEKIGVNHGFFGLGGNSIKAIKLCQKIEDELGVYVPVVQMFEQDTIKSLVANYFGTPQEEELNEETNNHEMVMDILNKI